jgi:ring-1,2-phenylacetyl-CoA epoxidase subunit PaaE
MASIDFHKLRVAEVKRETPDAVSVRFELPDALREAFAFRAGQHLTFRREIGGEEVRRNYSVCVSPSEGVLKIGVKKIAGGAFSSWVNDELKAGDELEVMAPHGSFCWNFDAEARREYVAFRGRLGDYADPVADEDGVGDGAAFAFHAVLRQSQFVRRDVLGRDRGAKGSLSRSALGVSFPRGRGRRDRAVQWPARSRQGRGDSLDVGEAPAHVDAFFICGPGPMMDAVEAALLAKNVEKAAHSDRALHHRAALGCASGGGAGAGAEGCRPEDERHAQWPAHAGAFDPKHHSILDNVRAAGLPAPFACKGGVCATCRAKVTAGEVSMKVNYGLSEQEIADGYVLTCQATPLTEGVALTYDV